MSIKEPLKDMISHEVHQPICFAVNNGDIPMISVLLKQGALMEPTKCRAHEIPLVSAALAVIVIPLGTVNIVLAVGDVIATVGDGFCDIPPVK